MNECFFFTTRLAALVLLLFLLAGCADAPEYPNEPVITFESLSKSTLYQSIGSLPRDSLVVRFSFTDGDGNLSQSEGGTENDIFFYDSRLVALGADPEPLRFPLIDREGTGNGVSGVVSVTLTNTPLVGPGCIRNGRLFVQDPTFPVDTFSYEIEIRDRAGNVSNRIRTAPISLLCIQQ